LGHGLLYDSYYTGLRGWNAVLCWWKLLRQSCISPVVVSVRVVAACTSVSTRPPINHSRSTTTPSTRSHRLFSLRRRQPALGRTPDRRFGAVVRRRGVRSGGGGVRRLILATPGARDGFGVAVCVDRSSLSFARRVLYIQMIDRLVFANSSARFSTVYCCCCCCCWWWSWY